METRDLFLSSDERYDVWEVKRLERPHLLLLCLPDKVEHDDDNNNNHKEEEKDDDHNDHEEKKTTEKEKEDDDEEDDQVDANDNNNVDDDVLPLVDGADIPGWRRLGLVKTSEYMESVLNVGQGTTLFRRESQLPILSDSLSTTTTCPTTRTTWQKLRHQLMEPPSVVDNNNKVHRIPFAKDIDQYQHPCWFERENVPVILEPEWTTSQWNAYQTCQWNALVGRFGDHHWRFSDTHGACMTLRTYDKYVHSLEGMTDDSPLAVYDSQLFLPDDERSILLQDYTIPSCFDPAQDLFEITATSSSSSSSSPSCQDDNDDEQQVQNRPPYRWILMGPARSGTGLHIDPLGTHAWVTVIEGLKRWVLFPYGTDPAVIGMQDPQIPSAQWFASEWYPRAMKAVPNAVEILQKSGETVYVPAGWPHLVLNLSNTVALTHNYCTEYPSMDRLLLAVQDQEPIFYHTWVKRLQEQRPDLFRDDNNQLDNNENDNNHKKNGTHKSILGTTCPTTTSMIDSNPQDGTRQEKQ